MFWTRLLSGIVLLAIALATFSFGNVFLAVPLWLISLIAYRELTKALKCATDEKKFNALEWIGFVGSDGIIYATLFFTRDHTLLLIVYCSTGSWRKCSVMWQPFRNIRQVRLWQQCSLSCMHRCCCPLSISPASVRPESIWYG